MEEEKGQEKRTTPRVKREVIVQYSVKKLPHTEDIKLSLKPYTDISRTKDLAEKGVFFTTSQTLSPQTILNIELRLPLTRESISLEGKIVSCKEIRKDIIYGVGVEFINLGEEGKKLLKEFVQLFLKGKGKEKGK